jgi:hypothetical protein
MSNFEGNPLHRCGAHCRRTGQPCRNFPIRGAKRCRMHGGRAGRKSTHRTYAKVAIAGREEARIALELLRLLLGRSAGSSHKRLYAPRGQLTPEQLVAKAVRLLGPDRLFEYTHSFLCRWHRNRGHRFRYAGMKQQYPQPWSGQLWIPRSWIAGGRTSRRLQRGHAYFVGRHGG